MLRGFFTGWAFTLTGALLLRLAVIDWEVAEVDERAGEAGVDSDFRPPSVPPVDGFRKELFIRFASAAWNRWFRSATVCALLDSLEGDVGEPRVPLVSVRLAWLTPPGVLVTASRAKLDIPFA